MFNIQLYDLGYCDEKEFTRVVCVCKYKDKFVFSYNKKRNGCKLTPICIYKISTYGLLCYCEILEMDKLPEEYEMSDIMLSDKLPENLTYPESFRVYFETVNKKISEVKNEK